jgi:DNA-directed RNA polymerase subunit F
MDVLSEEIITDVEAKEILEKKKEEKLKYEQKNALEELKKFTRSSSEKIKNLIEDLKKIEKLREREKISIANFLPQDKDDLRVVLQKEYTNLNEDEIKLILEAVKKAI